MGIIRASKLAIVSIAVLAGLGMVILSIALPAEAQTPTATLTVVPATPTPTLTVVAPTPTATVTAVAPTPTPTESPLPPYIAFSPRSMSFVASEGGVNPAHQTLNIWNSGVGYMYWSLTDTAGWLDLNPVVGASTGEIDPVTVTVNIYGMEPGVYSGTVAIYSTHAPNSPQMVTVSLTISSVAPTVVPTATGVPTPTPTPTLTSTPTPTPGAGGALPPWAWGVIGVLAVLALAFGGVSLYTSGIISKMGQMFARGGEEAGELTDEDLYEGEYGDAEQPPDDEI